MKKSDRLKEALELFEGYVICACGNRGLAESGEVLAREVRRLQEDKDRLDFLTDWVDRKKRAAFFFPGKRATGHYGKNLRSAIDAAMSGNK